MEQTIERETPGLIYRPEERLHYDTTTWLAEALDGSMRTKFEFQFDGQELYGQDGGKLKAVFNDAITDAERLARVQPNLAFEYRRRKIEMDEYRDMISMAKGEAPNTMVVISDFPPELMNSTTDEGGYNTVRKQTMLRVITRGENGNLTMRSQSLDQSNRQALEAIYLQLGEKAEPGELLGHRIYLDMPGPEEQEFLIDYLMGVYDRALEAQYGGEYRAGRTPAERANTYEFVLAQRDLVDVSVSQQLALPDQKDKLRYDLAAAMDKRYRMQNTVAEVHIPLAYDNPKHENIAVELRQAGVEARSQGKSFSGCGATLRSENDLEQQLSELGYGNKSQEDKYGSLQFKCQKGHLNTRPRNQLIEKCKTCGISVKC